MHVDSEADLAGVDAIGDADSNRDRKQLRRRGHSEAFKHSRLATARVARAGGTASGEALILHKSRDRIRERSSQILVKKQRIEVVRRDAMCKKHTNRPVRVEDETLPTDIFSLFRFQGSHKRQYNTGLHAFESEAWTLYRQVRLQRTW